MHKGPAETEEFCKAFLAKLPDLPKACDIVIAAPYISLVKAVEHLSPTVVRVAAQNMSEHEKGAFTGEVSALMLKEIFVQYVILGHSERRSLYGETDQIINEKFKAARRAGLRPIFCIGETLEERESGKLESVLRTQVEGGLADVSEKDLLESVVAYEPVWAIGTGVTASPEQAQEAHAFVRSLIADLYGSEVAEKVRIQYGGSAKPGNAAELMAQKDIDGALVGGASLEPASFAELIANAASD